MNRATYDRELICQVIAVAKGLGQSSDSGRSEQTWAQLNETGKFLLASQACQHLSISSKDWRELLDRTRRPGQTFEEVLSARHCPA